MAEEVLVVVEEITEPALAAEEGDDKEEEEDIVHPSEGRHSYSYRLTNEPRIKRCVPEWDDFLKLRRVNALHAAAVSTGATRHELHPSLRRLLIAKPPVFLSEAECGGKDKDVCGQVGEPGSEKVEGPAAAAAVPLVGEEG